MKSQPSRAEFIALIAMLFASIALSIDAMLPALPQIARDFALEDVNRAQLVVTSFVLGMGLGTLFTGPLSDSFGRKPVLIGGAAVYILSALVATQADSLETLLGARLAQGVGAAGPRVVALAVVRDLYAGRGMARIMSLAMAIFTTVPAIAPSLGAFLISMAGWRAIFWAFIVFSGASALWVLLRLPETLAPEDRRPFSASALRAALGEMLAHPVVRLCILVQALGFGMLFAVISTIQPIFDISFGRAESFPLWFGAIAICAASASFLNAVLVMRLGMRRLVSAALSTQVVISGAMVIVLVSGVSGTVLFALFLFWQFSLFFQVGMTIGNLNAIAMDPMGHIAGMAASIIGAIATVIAVLLAVPVGLMFDGTPLPLAIGVLVYSLLSVWLMRAMAKAEQRLPA